MKSPVISVIVPAYNAEEYLSEMIESVLSQTFSNWELILVDDGSKDGTGAICDSYAMRDERIQVIHQTNAGEYESRRSGINFAHGDYLTFLDADDLYGKDYLELISKNIDDGVDVLLWGIREFDEQGETRDSGVEPRDYSVREFLQFVIENGNNSMCNKLFKKELFRDVNNYIRPIIRDNEDEIMVIPVLCGANRIRSIPEVRYLYRRHGDSASLSIKSEKFEYLLKTAAYDLEVLEKNGFLNEQLSKARYVRFLKSLSAYVYLAILNKLNVKNALGALYKSDLYIKSKKFEKKPDYNMKEFFILKCVRYKMLFMIRIVLSIYVRT